MKRRALHRIAGREANYELVFDRAGVVAFRCAEPDVSLVMVSFWRLFVVAFSPRNRWIEISRCERSA